MKYELRELVQEMLTEENKNTGIRKVYYALGDKIQNLMALGKTKKDDKIKELATKMFKTFRELENYLDKEYEGWD